MPAPEALLIALRRQLTDALQPAELQIRDDSAAHTGHAGARSGAHVSVRLVCDRFAGLRLLERHRLVYTAVADLLHSGIHALAIEALTPDEVGRTISRNTMS